MEHIIDINKYARDKSFTVCKTTRQKGVIGYGYRRSLYDTPVKGIVVGSYSCKGGGGYFLEREDTKKIIQVQSFKLKQVYKGV